MPIYIVVAAVAVALSLPLLFWALVGRSPQHASAAQNLTRGMSSSNLRDLMLSRPAGERAIAPLMESLANAARRITPQGFIDSLERKIVLAGRPTAWPTQRVLAAKFLLGLLGTIAGLTYALNGRSLGTTILAVLLPLGGFYMPDMMLRLKGQQRQDKVLLALPDTLDQMTICVQAGLGFEAAMARAGQSGKGPLSDELVRTLQEMQIGSSRAEALRGLAERTGVPELRQFVVALLQAESYGLPIAKVLNTQAEQMRIKRRQRAEERAMKMPVKMVFPLVFCILPTMFTVALGPAIVRLMEFLG